jgi:hypothetical protein
MSILRTISTPHSHRETYDRSPYFKSTRCKGRGDEMSKQGVACYSDVAAGNEDPSQKAGQVLEENLEKDTVVIV